MITLPDVGPGVGLIVDGAAGPAGGAGPTPAGGSYDAVSDATAAFAGNGETRVLIDIAPPLPAVAKPPPVAHHRLGGGSNRREMALLFLSGILFMLISSFFRRRHRRRLGWGMLPERSLFGRD